jgi:hypothetical protein
MFWGEVELEPEVRDLVSQRQRWIAPGRRIILLTVFEKTKRQERHQVERAKRAMSKCIAEEHAIETHDD